MKNVSGDTWHYQAIYSISRAKDKEFVEPEASYSKKKKDKKEKWVSEWESVHIC